MGFVKEGLLEKSLEEGSASLDVLSKVAPLTARDMQVLLTLFDERKGGEIEGPLNWYRSRKVNYDEDKGERQGADRDCPPAYSPHRSDPLQR